MWRPTLLLSMAAISCQSAGSRAPDASGSAAPQAAVANRPEMPLFLGACDASGAVELSEHMFVVGDDEDNVLRVYDADRGGAPIFAVDLSPQLDLDGKKRKKLETDIEAATRVGDLAFWLTSHGRNSKGKLKAERFRFFATTTAVEPAGLKLVGKSYSHLLDDLLADPRLGSFQLGFAAERAPKEAGGLNIEGMTERVEGGVWIGFRNPNPGGKALLVPFVNPERVVHGERAKFGDPLLLDLGGLGVRALSWWQGRYLIAAGHYSGGAESRLFSWDGGTELKDLALTFADFNPEGFFTPETRDRVMLLSDDGSRAVGEKECKRVRDPAAKSFRGRWLALK